jgi:sigma-B regulation protein RsbQ
MNEVLLNDISRRNNVTVLGHGSKTLMFGHGFGCDQNTWRLITPAFEEDYRIILFDYVGAGNSDLSAWDHERYSDLQGYAQDIVDICDDLGFEDVIFIGHSVSSMIGLLAVKLRPTIFEKIVFIGPSPRYINDVDYKGGIEAQDLDDLLELMDSNYLGWSAMIAPSIMGNPEQPQLSEGLAQSFCATDPEIAKTFARVTFLSDNRADLSLLDIPNLTIQCNDDFLTSKWVAEYINQHTKKNTIAMLDSSGHCPHLSDPNGVIQAIKSFI